MVSKPILLRVNQVSLTGDDVAPHRRILAIFGLAGKGEWHHTQKEAIHYIESWGFSYYLLKDGRAVRLKQLCRCAF